MSIQKFSLEIETDYYNKPYTEEDIRTMFEVGTLVEDTKLLSVKEIK